MQLKKLKCMGMQRMKFQLESNLNQIVYNNSQKVECQIKYRVPKLLFQMYRKGKAKSVEDRQWFWSCNVRNYKILCWNKNRIGNIMFETVRPWHKCAICGSDMRYAICLQRPIQAFSEEVSAYETCSCNMVEVAIWSGTSSRCYTCKK